MTYFTIAELCKSAVAQSRGIANDPDAGQRAALVALVDNVLDPLRRAYGSPIYVTSGFRSTALNAAVGGVKNSQHLKGEAADITAGSPEENEKIFRLAIKMDLPYDQIIDENNYRWIHISFTAGNVRHQILHL